MAAVFIPQPSSLLFVKGHAVGTFFHFRIGFVRSYLHLSERAVVFTSAVMLALSNGTLNRTICFAMTIHDFSSFVLLLADKTECFIEIFVPSNCLALGRKQKHPL